MKVGVIMKIIKPNILPTVGVKKVISNNDMDITEFIKEKETFLKENNLYIEPVQEENNEEKSNNEKKLNIEEENSKKENSKKENRKNKSLGKEEE